MPECLHESLLGLYNVVFEIQCAEFVLGKDGKGGGGGVGI